MKQFISFYAGVFLFLNSCKPAHTLQNNQVASADSVTVTKAKEEGGKKTIENENSGLDTLKEDYQASEKKYFDLVHTRLSVRFDWAKQYLLGVATLTLKPHFYKQNELLLDAKGFVIESVKFENAKTELKYIYDNKKIKIDLGKYFFKEEDVKIQITYIARPNLLTKGGSEAITSDIGLYFINPEGKEANKPRQVWTQGETQSSSCWFPTIDAPNQKTTQEIFITVDNKYVTLSNGFLISQKINTDGTRTDYWKQDLPHAPYLFMLAAGEFEIVKDKWKNIEVNYYVEKPYKPFAKKIFGNTPEMIDFFSKKLNYPFPWAKYSQIAVRDYVSGAMENTTATVHGEEIQTDSRSLLDENKETVIAHELFHHWFGDLVTCESWSNIPLNESFANYSEYLWLEYKYGVDEADYHGQDDFYQYLDEAQVKQVPLIRYHYKNREDMFDHHSYEKGGRILHLLRKTVGDEAFFAALNLYLKKNKFKTAELSDLRTAFEEITGEDLNLFFDQWFLASGHPVLDIKQGYKNGKIILTVRQSQAGYDGLIYKLPLKVEWHSKNGKKFIEKELNKIEEAFEITDSSGVDYVLVDPQQNLPAIINHQKTIAQLVAQYQFTDRAVARNAAVNEIGKLLIATQDSTKKIELTYWEYGQVQNLLLNGLHDKYWKIRELLASSWNGYEGPLFTEMENTLKKMALHDPKSMVRAAAIRTLSTFNGKDYTDIYQKSFTDSSYSVNAIALDAYLKSGAKDLDKAVAGFKNSDNINIVLVLADYFTTSGDKQQMKWFTRHLTSAKPNDLYILLQYFGRYLLISGADEQQTGIKLIEQVAQSHSSEFVKTSATQTLELLIDLPGAREILDKLKNSK